MDCTKERAVNRLVKKNEGNLVLKVPACPRQLNVLLQLLEYFIVCMGVWLLNASHKDHSKLSTVDD